MRRPLAGLLLAALAATAALGALGGARAGAAGPEGERAGPAGAEGGAGADWLAVEGKLSDQDFYRLVSCGAPPGGPCALEPVAWPPERARRLAVALADPPPGVPGEAVHRAARALDRAVAEINRAGAALRLARAPKGAPADVTVHLSPSREGEPIEGTGIPGVDGEVIGAALVTVWWDEAMGLTDAVVVLAADLLPADVEPVLLEEMTQAMGLMTDIRSPAYEGVSVFSEDSNAATRLGPQDREALRLHYPPGEP